MKLLFVVVDGWIEGGEKTAIGEARRGETYALRKAPPDQPFAVDHSQSEFSAGQ